MFTVILSHLIAGFIGFGVCWWLCGKDDEDSCYDPATRKDLAGAEERIIAAFGERVDPEAQKKLDALYSKVVEGKAKVQAAIDANK